jgi:hypothetical protein
MAKAYRVKHDVSFPRVISRGEEEGEYATEGANYPAGSILHHNTMTPRDQRRAEEGDLDHLLEPLSDEDASNYEGYDGSQEPEVGVFIPEHEAEAHALEAAGHHVVPKSQVLELQARGQEHAARYQEAVKDAGMDRRPNQEFLAQERDRIPDEILTGSESPSGAPHNPGPEERPDSPQTQENAGEDSSPEEAARPRPLFGNQESDSEQGSDQSSEGERD